MIKTIVQKGPYMSVSHFGGNLPYIIPGTQAGQVRFNTNLNIMEVYDGSAWQNIEGHAEVGLNHDAERILDWANKKMQEEAEYEKMAEDHPAVRAAMEAVRKAEEQLKIVSILCKEEK